MTKENEIGAFSGWPVLFAIIVLIVLAGYSIYLEKPTGLIITLVLACILLCGFYIVEPYGSKVLLLFGSYLGTDKTPGFKWRNPLLVKRSVSLRARTLNGEKLKVNDHSGNPVEIAVIVVWRVRDTFKAMFEVDNYDQYVALQSETAVRHLASSYPYDADDESVSLRRNTDEVSLALQKELQDRLEHAGVQVLDARLSHLAYAPEIASAMLRRQQATAIIAARQRIVEGAVSMVEMALDRLEEYQKLNLDEERKAAMVSNLLVVLCSDHSAQPVLNTGTLYP